MDSKKMAEQLLTIQSEIKPIANHQMSRSRELRVTGLPAQFEDIRNEEVNKVGWNLDISPVIVPSQRRFEELTSFTQPHSESSVSVRSLPFRAKVGLVENLVKHLE